jgi:hypothetical protein
MLGVRRIYANFVRRNAFIRRAMPNANAMLAKIRETLRNGFADIFRVNEDKPGSPMRKSGLR